MNRFFLLFLLLLPTFAIGQSTATLDGSYVSNMFSAPNFVINPNCQKNTSSISTSAGSTLSRSTTTPLVAGTECNIADAGAWDAIWGVRTVDAGMSNRLCEVGMTLRGAATGTTTLAVLDGATTVFTQTITLSTTTPSRVGGTFPCGSTLSAFTVKLSGTDVITQTIEVGNVYLGRPVTVSSGTITTEWQSYTSTVTNLGAGSGTVAAKYRRVGDTAEIEATFTKDATPGSGASAVWFSLPSGLVADTAKIASGSTGHYGTAFTNDTTAAASALSSLYQNSVGGVAIACGTSSCTGASYTANSLWRFKIGIPIVGWSSTDVVSPEASLSGGVKAYRSGSGQAISADTTTELVFNTERTDPRAEYDTSTGRFTAKSSGWYDFSYGISVVIGATPPTLAYGLVQKNGTGDQLSISYRSDLTASKNTNFIGSGTIYLNAGDYLSVQFRANGQAVTVDFSTIDVSYFNVVMSKSTATQSVYVQGPVRGSGSGTAAPAEYLGEVITPSAALITTAASAASDTTVQVSGPADATLSLTPGVFEVCYSVTGDVTTGTAANNATRLKVWVTDVSNVSVGRSERILQITKTDTSANAAAIVSSVSNCFPTNITSNATYKLRIRRVDVAGTGAASVIVAAGTYDSNFYAVRIK
jgi:hypothetical protein